MKAPAFQLYAADFYMDTVGWTCEEVGIYFRLLMAEWVNGPLQNDPVRLAKTCQISTKKFIVNFNRLATKFVQNEEGFLINIRLEQTREKQEFFQESQRLKGKKSGEKRNKKINRGSTGVQPNRQPKVNPSSSSSFSSSIFLNTLEDNIRKNIKKESWEMFCEMRDKIKHPLTEKAAKGIISELIKINKNTNQDMSEILEKSARNDWRDVYALTNSGGNNGTGNSKQPEAYPAPAYNEDDDPFAEEMAAYKRGELK